MLSLSFFVLGKSKSNTRKIAASREYLGGQHFCIMLIFFITEAKHGGMKLVRLQIRLFNLVDELE